MSQTAVAPEQTATSVVVRRSIAAPVERVYRAWTDPAAVKQWMAPGPEMQCVAVEMDVRVGGAYRFEMRHSDGDVFIGYGEYREVTPPSRLVYTWMWENSPVQPTESQVTVEFNETRTGTELVLTHVKLASEESVQRHTHGWNGCLDSFAAYVSA